VTSGISRPQTLPDVLNQLQGAAEGNTDTSTSGVGYFAEADEPLALADFATAVTQAMPAWNGGQWSALSWG
jgi:hypothetical protein